MNPHFTGWRNPTFIYFLIFNQRARAALNGTNFLVAVMAALGAKLGALVAS